METWDELAYRKDQAAFTEVIQHKFDRINNTGCMWGQKTTDLIKKDMEDFKRKQDSKVEDCQTVSRVCLEKTKEYRELSIKQKGDLEITMSAIRQDLSSLRPFMMEAIECTHKALKSSEQEQINNMHFQSEVKAEQESFKKEITECNEEFREDVRNKIEEVRLRWYHIALQAAIPTLLITIVFFMFQSYTTTLEKRMLDHVDSLKMMIRSMEK
jgi:hypothetical protein